MYSFSRIIFKIHEAQRTPTTGLTLFLMSFILFFPIFLAQADKHKHKQYNTEQVKRILTFPLPVVELVHAVAAVARSLTVFALPLTGAWCTPGEVGSREFRRIQREKEREKEPVISKVTKSCQIKWRRKDGKIPRHLLTTQGKYATPKPKLFKAVKAQAFPLPQLTEMVQYLAVPLFNKPSYILSFSW